MRIIIGLVLLVLIFTTACSKDAVVDRTVIVPAPPIAMTDLPTPVAELLKSLVSEQSGLPPAQISLQQAEAMTWNDSCLGLAQPNEMCLLAITRGYRATFATPRGEYVVHSSQNGRSRRLASP